MRALLLSLFGSCASIASLACSGETKDGVASGGSATLGGGSPASGAATANGGAGTASGGADPTSGGAKGGTGGVEGTTGGRSATGGAKNSGGANGGKSSAGASGNGASTGTGGAGGASAVCKRGIATNAAPGAAFFPALGWWYNWSPKSTGSDVGIEFTPMVWGSADVNATLPAAAKYLLTFNEPNFHAQSNLTAAQAASYWPTLESKANALDIPLVSPGMNFCGPATNCNGTSPYQYLKDFFAACAGCKVDYVAVHWYNCDLPSLKDYLEPGGNLEGFEQFGKPIWLTEFSCSGSSTVAQQEAYMRAAVPYLELNPHVFRYSWFSADPIPTAKLMNDDGSPTTLGKVYSGLPGGCQ